MAKKKTYNPLVGFNTPYFTNLEESNAYNAGEADSRINALASTPAYSADAEDTGFLSAIGRGLTSGAAGVVQGQAQLGNLFGVGDGQLAQYLQGVNERNARKKEYTIADMIPFATDYWTNPEGVTYDVSNLLGSSGAMMAETGALMTGAGAVGGALGLGGAAAAGGGLAGALSRGASVAPKAVDKLAGWMAGAASKRGYEKLANVLSGPMGRMYALNILKTPIEVSSEAGQAGADALAEGASVDEARTRAGVVAAIQMPLLAMSNTFESANLGSLFTKETGKKVSKQGIMSILGSITQEGLQNAWEEGMQQSSQEYAADKQSLLGVVNPLQWSEEAQQQAAVGGVGGAVLGLGNAAGGRLIGKKQDEAETQPEPQPQPQQQTTADPTKGARQFLDDLAENAETPEDRKIIGDMADAENPEDVMAAARKFGWKPADEQETVTANSTAEEQQQAATDAVNQTINNMNNAEEDAAEPPTEPPVEPPVEPPTGQQGNVGGGRPMDKMSAARQNIPAQLAQNKSTAKYLDKDGNVDTGKLRGSVRLKRFLDETPDAMVVGKKALAGDTNAITQFLKYTPAKQAAILDAIDNGADNWKLTDQDKEAIKSYDVKQRAKGVTNLRDAVTKAVNGAGYNPTTDKGKALAVAKNGSEQELLNLAKQLKVTIPEIINRVAAPTENVTAKPPKPDKAPAGDGNNNNNNNGNQGDNGNAPIEAKQNLGEYTLSQVIKGKNGGMVFKYRHAGNNGTVALIGRSVKGHYVASIVKKGEKAADKKITFNSLEEAENYVATYKEPASANDNNNNGNAGNDNGNVEPPATPPTPVTPPAAPAPATATAAKPTKAKLAIGNSNTMLVKSTESGDYGFKPTAGMSFSKEEMEDLKAAGFKYSPTVGWWRAKDTEAVQKFIDKYKVKETEGGNDNAGNDQNDMGNSGSGTGQQNNGQNPQSGQGQQGQGNNQGQGQNQQTQGLTADERKKLFDKAKAAVNQTTERYANGEISMNEAKADIQKIGEAYFAELKNKKSELSNDAYIDQYRRLVSEPIARLQEIKVKDDNGNNGNINPPAQEPIVTDYPQYGIKITEVTKRNHNELLYPEAEVAKIRAKNDAAIWGVVQKVLDEFKKDLTIEPKTAKNKLKEIKKAFKTGNKQPPYNYALMDKIDNAINSINTLNTERLKKVKEQIEQEKQQKAQAYTDAVKKCREDADAIIKDFSEKKLDYDAAKTKIQELIDGLPKQLADAGLKALTAKDKASVENKLVALDRTKEKIDNNQQKEVPLAVSDPNDRDAGIELIVTKVINEATPLSEDGKKVYDYFFKIFDEAKHDTGKRRWRKDVAHAAAKLIAFRAETWSKIFNDALGTKYTPLSFAKRYRFYFYTNDYVSEANKSIGQNSYVVDEDEKGKKITRPGSDIEISFSRRASSNTLFHELAHAFMYDLVSIVESGKAPQKLVDDLEKFKQWLWTDADLSDKEKSYYDIQAGTFKEEKLAQALVMHLGDEGMPAGVIGGIYKQLAKVLKFCIEKYQKIIDTVIADEKSTADEVNKAKAYSFQFEIPAEIKSAINDLVLYGREEELAQFEKDNPIKPIATTEVKTKVTKKEPTFSEQLKAIQDLSDEYKNIYDKDGVLDNDKLKEFEKRESAASKIYKDSNTPERKAAIQAALDVLGVKKKLINYDIEREKANKNIFSTGGNRLDQATVAADNFENDENLEELEVLNDEIRGIFLDNELLQGHHLDRLVETIFNKKGTHFSEDEYVKALQEIEKIVLQDYMVSKPAEIQSRVKELGSLDDKANADAFLAAKVYADTILKTLKIGKEVQGLKRDLAKKEQLYKTALLKETVARKKAEQNKWDGPSESYSFDEAADSDLGETLYQAAWHGTPYIFDEFDNEHNGSGEGPNVHGWGLYFAKNKDVSAGYREKLSKKKETGRFEITLPNGKQYYISNFKDAASRRIEYKDGSLVDITKEPAVVGALNLLADNNMDKFGLDDELTQRINDVYNKDISLSKQMAEAQLLEDIRDVVWGIQTGSVSSETVKGALLSVEIPNSDVLLDEDEKFVDQPKVVQEAIIAATEKTFDEEVDAIASEYPEITEARKMKKPEFHELTEEELQKEIEDRKKLHKELFSNYQLPSDDILRQRAIESNKSFYENDLSWYNENKGMLPSLLDDFKQEIEDSAREHEEMERIINRFVDQLPWGDYSKRAELRARLIMSALKQFDLYESAYNLNGADYYYYIETAYGNGLAKNASLILNSLGVKGIKYEGGIDGTGFVIFDAASVSIKERYDAAIAKNKDTLQRSYDEIVKKLEERFKGCKIEYVGNNDMRVTAPNGISFLVKVKDKIVLNEKQAEKARKAHGISKDKQVYAVGAYTPVFNGEVNGIVKVALNSKKGTETHEITHAAIATSLTDKEYDALMSRGEQIAKETGAKANKEELVCNAVQNYVVARENGYVTAFTAEERAELEKTPWGKMLLNLNRAGREAQLFSKLNQEKLSQTAWGKMVLAKYKLKRAMAKLFKKVYDFVKNMQAVFQAVDNFHNVARKIEMGEVWKNKKNLRSNKTQYQIVGEHGASADQAKLNQAKDMERSGSSKEEIFDATGWWRGADSRWRFEIKDILEGVKLDKISEKPIKLVDIYDNEELYAHYPFLRDVPVKEEPMVDMLGWSDGKSISLLSDLAKEDAGTAKKVLLHELQHVIQAHEGFASGGNSRTAVAQVANAFWDMTFKKLPALYDKVDPKYAYWKSRLRNILAREKAGAAKKTDADQKPKLEAKIQKANEAYLNNGGDKRVLERIEQYEANLDQLKWQEEDFEGNVDEYVRDGFPSVAAREYYSDVASEYYYRALHGEQEARATEKRSDNPSKYPWQDMDEETNWDKRSLIIYDNTNSAARRGPLDESLADIDAAYKEQLDNALASGANNSELVAIMMAHQDAYFARLNDRERERLEKQKLRANELRELRRMFKNGEIDEYTIGGVVIRRNENGEEETVSVTNDFSTRKYVNRRGEGKNFANATEALKDAVHSTPTRTFFATAKEWLKDQKDHFYRNWIDKNDDLGIFDKAYMQAMGDTVDAAETVRAKAQMVTNSANGAAFALIDGDEATVKAAQRKYGFKNAVSMRMIIDKLMEHKSTFADYIKKYYSDVAGDQAYLDAFGNFLVAKSLLEASNNHRIDYDKEVAKWKADGSKGSQPIFQEYKFPRGMTEEAVREVVKAAPKGFSALAEMYYKYNENLLDILQASGLISADLHKLLNGKYKAYCPLMRDFTDTAAVEDFVSNISAGKGIANVTDPLQRRRSEGSSRDIVSPLEVTVKSTSAIIARCERNKVGQIFVRRAEEAGMTELCERVQGNAGDAKNCIFTVMFNGEKQAYRTTPEMYPAVTHCFEPAIKLQMGFLTAPARLLRAGATMSPSFIIRNFLRDTIFASISSKNGFIPIFDSVRGAYTLWQNEQRRAEFDAAGIISSAFYGDDEGVRRSLDEMAGGKFEVHGFLDIIKAIGHYPVQFLKFMSDNIEASTRMGEFMRARQKGKTVDQAAYEAVEITLNFNRSGIEGQQVNRVIPFFNACIQGGDKLYRLFKEDTLGTIGRIGLYIVLPSIVLWALNHDEEWYKELDPNIKATNWLLPGGVRIPKPQEAGILFGTGAEAVLDTAFEQDSKSMSNFINAFKDAMLPNFLPTALLPIIEWQANYSFFRGKPIVNARQQKLPDEMQYGPYTSETAKFVGKYSGLSPVKIDNTVRNIGGTMGMALVQMPDLFAAEKQNLPAKKLSEMFIVRDFLVNDMNKNRTMNDFYSLVDAATKQHAAYGKAGKPTKEVSAINAANGLIAKNRKMIRDITESRKLNSLQKRARIDKIEKDSIRIAKIAIKKYGKIFDY